LTKRAYITNLGRSTWALVNTYYAVLREKNYFPDNVCIFTEQTYQPELDKVKAAVEILSEEFGLKVEIETKVVHDWDFLAAGKEIFNTVKAFKDNGYKVAIDITPGRKALVVAALITGIKVNIDYVFYLAIRSTENAAKPYMMIPRQIQNIRDFMNDARKVVG
jgi:hypothetical protein